MDKKAEILLYKEEKKYLKKKNTKKVRNVKVTEACQIHTRVDAEAK